MQSFVSSVHSLWLSVILTNIGQSFFYCIQVLLIRVLLVINNRLLESLCQVHTMNRVETGQVIPVKEHVDEIVALFM